MAGQIIKATGLKSLPLNYLVDLAKLTTLGNGTHKGMQEEAIAKVKELQQAPQNKEARESLGVV